MTMRERMLAVVQRREHDRVPFVQYDGLAAPNEQVWAVVGRENMGILRWCTPYRIETPHCRWEGQRIERDGREAIRTTLHTPAGTLTEEKRVEPAYGSASTREHFVKEPKDYDVLRAYLMDSHVVEDMGALARIQAELGEDGLLHAAVARTPYQQLWIQWVSLEDLCLHLVDCPERVAECVRLMGEQLRRTFEIARHAPLPYVDVPDNITAPVIGPRYFEQYCVPYYDELAEMLDGTGMPVFVHMDGDLKPLWEAIGRSGVRGLDSLSPPPDNDTSAGQAVAMWPEMRVFLNFPSSVHLAGPEAVYAKTQEILAEAGHSGRLSIQISENVPRDAWRTSFPQIVRAIRDFGRP